MMQSQAVILSILQLALLQPIRSARIVKNEQRPTSLVWLNQSRTGKDLLWEQIDQIAGRFESGRPHDKIQVFADSEVQGTVGTYKKGFNQLRTTATDFLEMDILGTQHRIYFTQVFSKEQGKVLLFQSDDHSPKSDYSPLQTPEGLTALLSPLSETLRDVRVRLGTKFGGQPRYGIWYGSLTTPKTDWSRGWNQAEVAWQEACLRGTQGTPQKLVIPLEYNSFNARKRLARFGPSGDKWSKWLFEDLRESEATDASEYTKAKRMQGYRAGLLYIKYTCHGFSSNDPKICGRIQISKVSVMLEYSEVSDVWRHSQESGYEKVGSYPSGPSFFDAI